MAESKFVSFPPKLIARLMELECEKINLIKGFMYTLDAEGRWTIADDLSGVHSQPQQPTQ